MLRVRPIFRALPLILVLGIGAVCGCEPTRDQLFVAFAAPRVRGQSDAAIVDGGASGVGGAVVAGGGGGRAGTGTRAIGLDPTITFVWTETPPGPGLAACEPATFAGTFVCMAALSKVEGTLVLSLSGSSGARLLEVSSAALTGLDDATMEPFLNAMVTGRLNCATRSFSGSLVPTVTEPLTVPQQVQLLSLLVAQPKVTGELRGALDPSGSTIKGDLTLMFESQACKGTFSVEANR